MAEQYFVKRGETVKGPFSLKKMQQLEAAKKLKAIDLIGTNESGPWERVTAYNRILSSFQRGTIPVVATIEEWRVKRGLLGQFQVNFKCPGCKAELKSDENEISQRDYCPECGKAFVLDQRIAAEISSHRDRIAADKASRDLAKQERKREKEKERERQYLAKQERKREEEERKREEEERKREEEKERLQKQSPPKQSPPKQSPQPQVPQPQVPQPRVPQKTTTAGPTNDTSTDGVLSAGCFVFFVIGGLIFLSSLDYDYGSLLDSAKSVTKELLVDSAAAPQQTEDSTEADAVTERRADAVTERSYLTLDDLSDLQAAYKAAAPQNALAHKTWSASGGFNGQLSSFITTHAGHAFVVPVTVKSVSEDKVILSADSVHRLDVAMLGTYKPATSIVATGYKDEANLSLGLRIPLSSMLAEKRDDSEKNTAYYGSITHFRSFMPSLTRFQITFRIPADVSVDVAETLPIGGRAFVSGNLTGAECTTTGEPVCIFLGHTAIHQSHPGDRAKHLPRGNLIAVTKDIIRQHHLVELMLQSRTVRSNPEQAQWVIPVITNGINSIDENGLDEPGHYKVTTDTYFDRLPGKPHLLLMNSSFCMYAANAGTRSPVPKTLRNWEFDCDVFQFRVGPILSSLTSGVYGPLYEPSEVIPVTLPSLKARIDAFLNNNAAAKESADANNFLYVAQPEVQPATRVWRDIKGNSIRGYASRRTATDIFIVHNGSEVRYPIRKFSTQDRAYIRDLPIGNLK